MEVLPHSFSKTRLNMTNVTLVWVLHLKSKNDKSYLKYRLKSLQGYFFVGKYKNFLKVFLNTSEPAEFERVLNSGKVYCILSSLSKTWPSSYRAFYSASAYEQQVFLEPQRRAEGWGRRALSNICNWPFEQMLFLFYFSRFTNFQKIPS